MTISRQRARMRGAATLLLASLLGAGCGADDEAAKVAATPSKAGVEAIDAVRPTGAHPVGVRAIAAGDEPIWLFYPASAAATGAREPAAPAAYGQALARRFGGQAAADLLAARGPANWEAPADDEIRPLVIFSPGASLGSRDYRSLLSEIASQGFVVAALSPYGSPAASEARYAGAAQQIVAAPRSLVDTPLPGPRFNSNCTLLVGHSIGGAGSVLALAQSPAFVAAVNLDGDHGGASRAPAPARPILYLTGTNPDEGERTLRRRAEDWAVVSGGNDEARRVTNADLRHLDVLDAALLPATIIPADKREGRFGPLSGRDAHASIGTVVTNFLRQAAAGCRPLSSR